MMGKEVENQAEKVLQSASFLRFSPNSSFGSCVCSSNNVFKCCYSSHSHVIMSPACWVYMPAMHVTKKSWK